MDDKLFKLAQYFYNGFSHADYPESLNQPINQFAIQYIHSLQSQRDVILNHAKTLIDIYSHKVNQLTSYNQNLVQQMDHLKQGNFEDKEQLENLLDKSKQIIQQLKILLMQKDDEQKQLLDRIEHLQIDQIDELNLIKKQENQNIILYESRIKDQQYKYEQIIKQFKIQLENQKNLNKQLNSKIEILNLEIQKLTEHNQYLISSLLNTNQTNYYSQISQLQNSIFNLKKQLYEPQKITITNQIADNFYIPILEVANITEEQFNTNFEISNNSQDQIFNYSFQQDPRILRDVLNCSYSRSGRLNMPKQLIESKDKQLLQDNDAKVSRTNSQNKNLQIPQNPAQTKLSSPLRDFQQLHSKDFDNQDSFDPYYIFFVLTAQCVKMNSKYFDQIAQLNIVQRQWIYVYQNRIGMNFWYRHLKKALHKTVGIQI